MVACRAAGQILHHDGEVLLVAPAPAVDAGIVEAAQPVIEAVGRLVEGAVAANRRVGSEPHVGRDMVSYRYQT
jgi:hypothetical protein